MTKYQPKPRSQRRAARGGGCAAAAACPRARAARRRRPSAGASRKSKPGWRTSSWVSTATPLRSMTSRGRSFCLWLGEIWGTSGWRRWATWRGSCRRWKSCSDDGEAAPREMATDSCCEGPLISLMVDVSSYSKYHFNRFILNTTVLILLYYFPN